MAENYYVVLELFLDPPEKDWTKLNEKIDEKKNEWNKKRNRPDGLKFASLCERIETFREELKDEKFRKSQANAARIIKFKELDSLLDQVAVGDCVAPKQVEQLVKRFQNVFSEKTIRDRVQRQKTIAEPKPTTLPPPPKPNDDPTVIQCDSITLKKIRDCLDVLGKSDVYAALGLSRSSSLTTLNDGAQKLIELACNSIRKTSEVSVSGELGGLLKSVFKTENHRKGFDLSWSRFQIEEKLKTTFNLRAADKTVTRENFERSVQDIVQEGASVEYAQWYAYDYYVVKRQCPDPRVIDVLPLEEKTQCPNCFRLNGKDAEICGNCGAKLRVECPKCHTVSFAQNYCPKCGFALGDLENVKNYLKTLQNALAAQNFDEALRAYNAARDVWVDNPKLPNFLLELRDLRARRVFDDVERELNAGRLEDARTAAAKLSFDGGDSPLVARYKNEFERRLQNEKTFMDAINAADACFAQGRYFDAAAQLDAAAKIAPTRPILTEKRNKIASFNQDARKELASICLIQDVELKERRLNELLKRHPDFSEVRRELESIPPCAPSLAEAINKSGEVEICWRESVSQGNVRYRVVRRIQKDSTFFDDVCVCESTEQTSVVDATLGEFIRYQYAVYAIRNRVNSEPRLTNVVVKEGAIRNVRVLPLDGGLEVVWDVSKGFDEIVVERRAKGETRSTQLTPNKTTSRGLRDVGLQNDLEYEYSATLVYRNANDVPQRTAPLRFVGTPSRPLQRVEDWKVNNEQNSCSIRWKKPTKGDVCFLISTKPLESKTFPGTKDDLIKLFGEPAILTRRQTSKDGYESAVVERKSNALTSYITPVTLGENSYVLGESYEVVALGAIQNVRIQRCDSNVYVSWDWTPGVDRVYIQYSEIKEPGGLDDQDCRQFKLTRVDYEHEKAWTIRLPEERSAFAKIYQVALHNGKTLFSSPETLFLKTVYIKYFCEKRDVRPDGFGRFFSKKRFGTFLKIQRDDGQDGLPEIILVRESGRPPLRRDDGDVLARLPATDKPEQELRLDEYFTEQNCDAYFRCYLANTSDRARYALLDPIEADLRLFREED